MSIAGTPSTSCQELKFYFPEKGDWPDLVGRLFALGCRGAVMGPECSGRTTFLRELETQLRKLGLDPVLLDAADFRAPVYLSCFRTMKYHVRSNSMLLIDNADLLSPLEWLYLRFSTKELRALVVVVDGPCFLPVLMNCRPAVQTLHSLVREIFPGASPELLAEASLLFLQHKGDMREVLRSLADPARERSPQFLAAA